MRSYPQYPIQIQKPLLYDKGISLGALFKRPKLVMAGQPLHFESKPKIPTARQKQSEAEKT